MNPLLEILVILVLPRFLRTIVWRMRLFKGTSNRIQLGRRAGNCARVEERGTG